MPCARSAPTFSTRTRRSCAPALSDTGDALRAGFPEKAAGSAATARGYWWILRDAFAGQRGEPAAAQLDRAFERLVGAARTGKPAATAAAAATIEDDLLAFRAAPLSAAEQARRAGQLDPLPRARARSSTDAASRTAASSCRFEIQEAITFRDGAAVAFGDLQSYLAARDLAATRSVQRALAGLDTRLGDARARHRGRRPRRGRVASTKTATSALVDDVYPDDWKAGTAEADFDVIATLLDRGVGARGRRRLRRAESSRLEAYAIFELGPEQRLRGLAPSLFQRVEGLFWYGADGHDGLAQLLRQNASADELAETLAALDLALKESAERDRRAARSPAPPSSRTARSSSSARGSRRC